MEEFTNVTEEMIETSVDAVSSDSSVLGNLVKTGGVLAVVAGIGFGGYKLFKKLKNKKSGVVEDDIIDDETYCELED